MNDIPAGYAKTDTNKGFRCLKSEWEFWETTLGKNKIGPMIRRLLTEECQMITMEKSNEDARRRLSLIERREKRGK